MVRLIIHFLFLCLAVGTADAVVRLAYTLAEGAQHAHQSRQLRHSKFNKALWNTSH